jgi:hypothetical protein
VTKISLVNEDSLYDNLDWLSNNQDDIENRIYKYLYHEKEIKEVLKNE